MLPRVKFGVPAISRLVVFCALVLCASELQAEVEDSSRLTDSVLPLQVESIPQRPAPILELGDPFFATGAINHGYTLPTGAVWQPSLIVWGTYRTAIQSYDDSEQKITEWSNRFDLFSNLYLTSTERVLIGIRPLDKSGRFTRYTFDADNRDEDEEGKFDEEFNSNIRTVFFEGDLGEMFPLMDPKDSYGLDVAVAVGRQPIRFQDGMLVDDSLDSLGLSKINLKPTWAVNWRSTAIWAWDELNRDRLPDEDSSASMYGIFNEIDFRRSTVEIDFAYVDADRITGSGFFTGLGATQRLGVFNTTVRLLGSAAEGSETEENSNGGIGFAEIGYTPVASENYLYLSAFWALDNFRSASRDPSAGGPLGAVGVLYASPGLGRYIAALDSSANDAFGGAAGYQMFFNDTRTQLLFELGQRYATENTGQRATATGVSLQQAVGQRNVVRVDLFTSLGDPQDDPEASANYAVGYGGRLEWTLRL